MCVQLASDDNFQQGISYCINNYIPIFPPPYFSLYYVLLIFLLNIDLASEATQKAIAHWSGTHRLTTKEAEGFKITQILI